MFERSHIRDLTGYVYGEQPSDPSVVKLNTNENPYGPSPRVQRAIANFQVEELRRYPDATSLKLRRKLAEYFKIQTDQIVVTNGGDEGIRLAVSTFVESNESLCVTNPGYSLYPVVGAVNKNNVVEISIPLEGLLPDDFLTQISELDPKLLCLVNPHAPSGHLLTREKIANVANAISGILLIDEAYVDFVDPNLNHDLVPLIESCRNVLLLRTLSKGYSLAGLRVGWLMGDENLIAPIITKTRDSYNVDSVAQCLAYEALDDQDYVAKNLEKIRTERNRLRTELTKLGFFVPQSQSNFLLADVGNPKKASTIFQHLRTQKIFVRYFDSIPLHTCLRISIGTPEQNGLLLASIRRAL